MNEPYEIPEDEEAKAHYAIGGPSEADWALEKLDYYRSRQEEIEQVYNDRKTQLDVWRETELTKHQPKITFFEAILKHWHEKMLEEDPKRKTISLPNGKLKHQVGGLKLIIDDEPVVIAWLTQNEELKNKFVKTVEKLMVAEIKAAFPEQKKSQTVVASDGEIIPGIHYERSDDSYKAITR